MLVASPSKQGEKVFVSQMVANLQLFSLRASAVISDAKLSPACKYVTQTGVSHIAQELLQCCNLSHS